MRKITWGMAKDDAGAAAVEFALIAPMLLLMALGVNELGTIVHERAVLKSAARSGTQAAFSATLTTSAGITAAVASMTTAADLAITNSGIGGSVTYTESSPKITCQCSDDTVITCVTGTCATGSVRYIATVAMSRTYTPLGVNLTGLPGGFNINLGVLMEGKSVLWVK